MLLRTFAIVFFSCTSLVGLTLVADPSVGAPQRELKRAPIIVETAEGDVELLPEVAITPIEQEIGMTGRDRSAAVAGMYFPQTKPGIVDIPVSGGSFPVDILFVGADGLIKNIQTVGNGRTDVSVRSPGQVSGYLQMAGGMASRLGIRPGDRLRT